MDKIVIKIGSNLLIKDNQINKNFIIKLSSIISNLVDNGKKVVIVSSGANAAGLKYLNLHPLKGLSQKQALCAIGQVQLMKIYEQAFDFYDKKVAQILLTRDDFSNRQRFLNLKNTLIGLNQLKIIPIINENDTISIEEIKFGDNDLLSAYFAIGWGADGLIILTSVDGIYDETGFIIKEYEENKKIMNLKKTTLGTGGIDSKIFAGKMASASGIKACICNGNNLKNINEFIENKNPGTIFLPDKKMKNKKAWIAYLSDSKGKIYINEGANKAILKRKSLLPIGINKIEGEFIKGDAVDVYYNSKLIAKGLTNYSKDETEIIKGKKSEEILKNFDYKEFIHADNLVLINHFLDK
ncbi:gamma-glutamyl kinase [Marinitoga sp. 1197]|uniref:glutamate 5-kinase n=1 Tax=Marinitoga sp. 1197 TaxID=1428449 RepID=UPI00064150DD|nr:glutamate 5-kinase [Marinitoga sp. 1197]KLO22072.1 gamma-glutamyl kinase [Marinitoga sp. 1197]